MPDFCYWLLIIFAVSSIILILMMMLLKTENRKKFYLMAIWKIVPISASVLLAAMYASIALQYSSFLGGYGSFYYRGSLINGFVELIEYLIIVVLSYFLIFRKESKTHRICFSLSALVMHLISEILIGLLVV